ncbi:hypothetical protein F1737_03895 [Methanoplanus sp. FWC-SCC4]|uniref:Uncharacterized protein n=1 Tax=Methanochimaera problematica TaxID=2609417 RepID=A0AA97FBM3_9EURY|nr:DUF6508 domain-containing protein [Methanoplanus sp. FWC-SCC4]WOF15897.1 hypothetical protein F1737_03895 [Methanoplanus sp. FWC-SCC4]
MNCINEVPTPENFDAIIKYLPVLEDMSIYDNNRDEIEKNGSCDEILDLVKCLYYNNWLINSRWQEWTSEAELYFGKPELLNDAGIESLRRILTVHVRIDRLFPGEIADLIKRGYLLCIIRRISSLKDSN